MTTGKLALLFPGQGAHEPRMLDGLVANKRFDEYYATIVDALGYAPVEAIERDPAMINNHLLSTLMTMLASSLSYFRFLEVSEEQPSFFAGYSIGEFTALHLAGCYDFPHLVSMIKERSSIINECMQPTPGGMIGVVGLPLGQLEPVVAQLQKEAYPIYFSNMNCAGQYSLAGSKEAIKVALERIAPLKPQSLRELPVAGPWHSPLLEKAQTRIADQLRRANWKKPNIPVIDNVTGAFLPDDLEAIKEQMIQQVTSPVLWDAGVKTLISHGCQRLIEVGYGNVLTKFGFFIDRSVTFSTFYGDERVAAGQG